MEEVEISVPLSMRVADNAGTPLLDIFLKKVENCGVLGNCELFNKTPISFLLFLLVGLLSIAPFFTTKLFTAAAAAIREAQKGKRKKKQSE